MSAPREEQQGPSPAHSRDKLDFVCILMVAWHKASCDMESDLSVIKIPWTGEPIPSYTTIARHLQAIPEGRQAMILVETAKLYMSEEGGATGPLGADSSGVETARYETVTRLLKKERDFVKMAWKAYLKYHIIAVLGLQIILELEITANSVNDVTTLPVMLGEMKRQGLSPGPAVLNADRRYGSDYNCGILFEVGMIPDIKQRMVAVNRGKPSRCKAARLFNKDEYGQRDMIEGIFRGEEFKRHQLRHDPQLKIKSFASNSYRGVFPNKQILHDYTENCAILCPSANYESSLRIRYIMSQLQENSIR